MKKEDYFIVLLLSEGGGYFDDPRTSIMRSVRRRGDPILLDGEDEFFPARIELKELL
ncbi:MAG: hypothetical protein R3346_00910 [Candidatus Spechtbacterales bacterium]|nr:hypothetical protein [Candidatus Spechtbacterales bacterium]